MDEYIGIVIKNQWDNILLHDGNFYIKTKVKENSDIINTIKTEIAENLDKEIFKIKKVYKEKLEHRYEILTIYLVEVGVYTNDFEFLKIDQIPKEIYSFEDKAFFEKYILKEDEYTTLLSSIFNLFILIGIVDILPIIKSYLNLQLFSMGVIFTAILFFVFKNIIGPKIAENLIKFNLNIKIANSITTIIIIYYCIKLIR
ncbi:hypothetical protein [Romboutsia lituseburensis]|uniref:Uncharacterized protein n=1 Tax=Romboutsia lituseburensis DSM 797 TaxID=1121325 RepID=A0A1G9IHI2_9FIRM|nr:hypothetical protein [Romboutsia lituseburensis]CEH33895.1 Hypothetical protein RLITU_1302 [Romboutsia lituseburensis]SDL24552.1 hypothetical protein SAMN04515677_101251 [Romboutsia lituseburensis DSM 797]